MWQLAGGDMEQAVQLAQGAAFHQAVARAHYLAGNFLQALHCAIHATSTPGVHPCLPQLLHSISRLMSDTPFFSISWCVACWKTLAGQPTLSVRPDSSIMLLIAVKEDVRLSCHTTHTPSTQVWLCWRMLYQPARHLVLPQAGHSVHMCVRLLHHAFTLLRSCLSKCSTCVHCGLDQFSNQSARG